MFKDIPLYGKELSQMNLDLHIKLNSLVVYRELVLRKLDIKLNVVDKNGRADLSLNIGDTFYYRDNRGFGIYVVHDVFMDSLGRKVIAFNDGYYQFFFIESVGASTFFGRVNLGLYSTVICIFHDDTLTYRNNNLSDIDTGNCWSAYRLGVEGTAKNNIKIYPNPAYNYINIEANDIHNITIFNLQGNTLLSCDNVKKYIDIQSIPRGIVIVRIISDNGIIYKQLAATARSSAAKVRYGTAEWFYMILVQQTIELSLVAILSLALFTIESLAQIGESL